MFFGWCWEICVLESEREKEIVFFFIIGFFIGFFFVLGVK